MCIRDRREGHEPWPTLAETGAKQPASGHSHDPFGELIGLVQRLLREGVEPEHDPLLQVGEQHVCRVGTRREEHQTDGDPGDPFGGDIEHRDEQPEEQQLSLIHI